jgi:hypothetical protein
MQGGGRFSKDNWINRCLTDLLAIQWENRIKKTRIAKITTKKHFFIELLTERQVYAIMVTISDIDV